MESNAWIRVGPRLVANNMVVSIAQNSHNVTNGRREPRLSLRAHSSAEVFRQLGTSKFITHVKQRPRVAQIKSAHPQEAHCLDRRAEQPAQVQEEAT